MNSRHRMAIKSAISEILTHTGCLNAIRFSHFVGRCRSCWHNRVADMSPEVWGDMGARTHTSMCQPSDCLEVQVDRWLSSETSTEKCTPPASLRCIQTSHPILSCILLNHLWSSVSHRFGSRWTVCVCWIHFPSSLTTADQITISPLGPRQREGLTSQEWFVGV